MVSRVRQRRARVSACPDLPADREQSERILTSGRSRRRTWLTMAWWGKPGTEIGADMSGRRRRDDGWDDGRPEGDAQGSGGPDPWLDGGAGDQRGGGYPAP